MNTLVTHISPDLDAAAACWLVRKYLPGWDDAAVSFVPAGKTLAGEPPGSNPAVMHVDTGMGAFDHHQTNKRTSATGLVFEHLIKKGCIPDKETEAVSRVVDYVTDVDHFAEVAYPEATSDRYDFCLHQLVGGLKQRMNDDELVVFVCRLLDAALQVLRNKVRAESEIKLGFVFTSRYGKSLIMNTRNDEALRLAQKQGFLLVVTRDPVKGYIRIKTPPKTGLDLTPVYAAVKKEDPAATWFLHVSKNMLLNGSNKTPDAVPSSLPVEKLVAIIKEI